MIGVRNEKTSYRICRRSSRAARCPQRTPRIGRTRSGKNGPLLDSKREFNGIGGVQTYVQNRAGSLPPGTSKLRPQFAPRAGADSFGTVVTKPPALPRCFNEKQGTSRGALAKIISTNVSIQSLRRLDDRRFDVSRGARVHRSACARLASGLDRRGGTSLRYPSRERNSKQPDQNERGRQLRRPFT